MLDLFNREGVVVVHGLIFVGDKTCRRVICAFTAQPVPARAVG